ncbi:D-2-hydroxyglutarate dehydrogenase, mitochondrial [Hordeum vulgare]|nr:D-2-hydroxyglutarate dehydrogenase, mitochondrial [Hordeum vulgare]
MNQNTDTYWGRIKTAFDERKKADLYFSNMHMDSGEKAMVNRWSTIQTACKKWHVIVAEMIRLFAMYHTDNADQEFRFLHVFSRIDSCEKWREVWIALDKPKVTYNPDAPTPDAAEGCPDGTKKSEGGEERGARYPTATGFDQAMHHQCQEHRCQEIGEIRCAVVGVDDYCHSEEVIDGGRHADDGEKLKVWYIVQRDLILRQMPSPATSTMSPTTPKTSSASPAIEEPHHLEPAV